MSRASTCLRDASQRLIALSTQYKHKVKRAAHKHGGRFRVDIQCGEDGLALEVIFLLVFLLSNLEWECVNGREEDRKII